MSFLAKLMTGPIRLEMKTGTKEILKNMKSMKDSLNKNTKALEKGFDKSKIPADLIKTLNETFKSLIVAENGLSEALDSHKATLLKLKEMTE